VSWLIAVLVLAAVVGIAVWWLERPLFYTCESPDLLEDFLRDLVSERSPWPSMEIHCHNRHFLTVTRRRSDPGFFNLVLESPDGSLAPLPIGPISSVNLSAAGDARRALSQLGVPDDVSLRIRCRGPMDPAVVERTRRHHA
jgi:hypothetical protein